MKIRVRCTYVHECYAAEGAPKRYRCAFAQADGRPDQGTATIFVEAGTDGAAPYVNGQEYDLEIG